MAGFLTGFITGAANRANEITQDNERQRNANIERSMQAFRASIERRQERDRELSQQLAQAQIVAHRVGGAGNAEAIVRAGLGPQLLSGQITMGGQPNAAPTPAPITGQGGLMAPPSATPTAPTAPGLGQPSQTPVAPSGGATVAPAMGDPRDAISATPTAPQQQPQASPEAPQEGGIMNGIRRAMFGREPWEGVDQEVRNRYLQQSGMQRSEMERLLQPDRPIPQMQGQVNIAPVPPAEMARMAPYFREGGLERFMQTGGRDTSGLINADYTQQMQERLMSIRAAAAQARTNRPVNIGVGHYNSAMRAMEQFLPRGMFRPVTDPVTNRISFAINVPSNHPDYARAQQGLATAMEAIGPALRGEVDGIAIGETPSAGAYAARRAGWLGEQQPTPNPGGVTPPPPAANPGGANRTPRATSTPQPAAPQTPSPTDLPRESTNRPPNVAEVIRQGNVEWRFSRMRGNTPVYTNGRQEIDGRVR